MEKLRAILTLIRWNNLVILLWTQGMVAWFLLDLRLHPALFWGDARLFCTVMATVLVAAAGYIINDYYDVKIDLINKPQRVVIDTVISRRDALLANGLLNTLALILAASTRHWGVLACVFLSIFGLWYYSNQLKRQALTGNIMVAVLTGAAVALPGILYGTHKAAWGSFAIFAGAITLIREVVKDAEDVKGDRLFGAQTLPIRWGLRRTKYLLYAIIAASIVVMFVLSGHLEKRLAWYFLVLQAPIAYLVYRLVKADKSADFRHLSQLCKWLMVAGVLGMSIV